MAVEATDAELHPLAAPLLVSPFLRNEAAAVAVSLSKSSPIREQHLINRSRVCLETRTRGLAQA
jgi:hypothetical protein